DHSTGNTPSKSSPRSPSPAESFSIESIPAINGNASVPSLLALNILKPPLTGSKSQYSASGESNSPVGKPLFSVLYSFGLMQSIGTLFNLTKICFFYHSCKEK